MLQRLQWLCAASILTIAFHIVPVWIARYSWWRIPGALREIGWANFHDLVGLLFAVSLIVRSPADYGLRVGRIKAVWLRTMIVAGGAVIAVATVYGLLPQQPFSGSPVGMWLVSPLAQDIVFLGVLYRWLEHQFPGHVHPRIPVSWALLLVSGLFSLWHLPSFAALPATYATFQLGYTFVGGVWVGITRQWTGSLLYATATHMIVNFIASR